MQCAIKFPFTPSTTGQSLPFWVFPTTILGLFLTCPMPNTRPLPSHMPNFYHFNIKWPRGVRNLSSEYDHPYCDVQIQTTLVPLSAIQIFIIQNFIYGS